MKKLLIKFSFLPYKTIVLSSGIICKHYRDGTIKTDIL